jgi:anti-sigma factor RsiW
MTSKFDDFESSHELSLSDWESDSTKPDCFELLSAYLDGEVTPQERQQVQYWLDNDPNIKQLYNQLRQLHSKIESIPLATKSNNAEELSTKVFQTIDRSHRKQRILVWGGSAMAALFIATISGMFSGVSFPSLRIAKSVRQNGSEPMMVAVAVNKPAVKIPKASVSSTIITSDE